MFEIAGALDFDRAETSDDHVLQNLLGQGAERIIRIGRIEIVSEDAYAQICIRQLFSASRPRLNSPAHSRDLVLDCVDRLPRHRRFSKNVAGWLEKALGTHRAADHRCSGWKARARFAACPPHLRPATLLQSGALRRATSV